MAYYRMDWALRRLGLTDKRRVGTGYEYRITRKNLVDLAERMGIETTQGLGAHLIPKLVNFAVLKALGSTNPRPRRKMALQ